MNLVDGNAISIRNNIVELATESPHKVLKEIKAVDLPNRHNIQEKPQHETSWSVLQHLQPTN